VKLEDKFETRVDKRTASADLLKVFEFYAHCILGEEDYEDRFKMIVKLQVEIQTLHDQFKNPLAYFMRDHEHLIQNELDKTFYTKTKDYTAHPERMVKDLLNFVYCLNGYGPFYRCPSECTREDQDL